MSGISLLLIGTTHLRNGIVFWLWDSARGTGFPVGILSPWQVPRQKYNPVIKLAYPILVQEAWGYPSWGTRVGNLSTLACVLRLFKERQMAKPFEAKLLRGYTIAVITAHAPSLHTWLSPGRSPRKKFKKKNRVWRHCGPECSNIKAWMPRCQSTDGPLTGSVLHNGQGAAESLPGHRARNSDSTTIHYCKIWKLKKTFVLNSGNPNYFPELMAGQF